MLESLSLKQLISVCDPEAVESITIGIWEGLRGRCSIILLYVTLWHMFYCLGMGQTHDMLYTEGVKVNAIKERKSYFSVFRSFSDSWI